MAQDSLSPDFNPGDGWQNPSTIFPPKHGKQPAVRPVYRSNTAEAAIRKPLRDCWLHTLCNDILRSESNVQANEKRKNSKNIESVKQQQAVNEEMYTRKFECKLHVGRARPYIKSTVD